MATVDHLPRLTRDQLDEILDSIEYPVAERADIEVKAPADSILTGREILRVEPADSYHTLAYVLGISHRNELVCATRAIQKGGRLVDFGLHVNPGDADEPIQLYSLRDEVLNYTPIVLPGSE